MEQDENKSSANMNSQAIRPKWPRSRTGTLLAVLALLLVCASFVMAWFGGQAFERAKWESKYDELEDDNQNLDAANAQLSEAYRTLEATNTQLSTTKLSMASCPLSLNPWAA